MAPRWTGSVGRSWSSQRASSAWNWSGFSLGRTRVLAVRPCLRALREEAFLPSSDLGPELCWAFWRLAAFWFSVAMIWGSNRRGWNSLDAIECAARARTTRGAVDLNYREGRGRGSGNRGDRD